MIWDLVCILFFVFLFDFFLLLLLFLSFARFNPLIEFDFSTLLSWLGSRFRIGRYPVTYPPFPWHSLWCSGISPFICWSWSNFMFCIIIYLWCLYATGMYSTTWEIPLQCQSCAHCTFWIVVVASSSSSVPTNVDLSNFLVPSVEYSAGK